MGHSYFNVRGKILARVKAKACAKNVSINQELRLGVQRRFDTVIVLTVNDAGQKSVRMRFLVLSDSYEQSEILGSGGNMVASLKPKGIDGRAPPGAEPAA